MYVRLVSRLHYIVVWVDHAEYRLVPRHESLGTRLRTVHRIGELSIDLFFFVIEYETATVLVYKKIVVSMEILVNGEIYL